MSRKVYIYSDISKLKEHPKYDEIRSAPHVTATSDLSTAMDTTYAESFTGGIMDIHSLVKGIVGEWNREGTMLRQYTKLSELARNRIRNSGDADASLILGFKRNGKDLLKAIRTLVEANVFPDDIVNPATRTEELFKEIWSKLESEDNAIIRYRATMHMGLEDEKKFKKLLGEILDREKVEKVVMHGFYFITPVQDRVVQLMENAGIEVIFLNCYNRNFPASHEIWRENFSVERGYQPPGSWTGNPLKDQGGTNLFGEVFEGRCSKKSCNTIKIIEYKSDIEFINDMERIRRNFLIYTADKRKTDGLLKEYFPEEFSRRHLLAFPVGQYLYYLHRMWDDMSEQILLDMDCVTHCFASGWVYKDGLQGKNYMTELQKLDTFLKGCRTIDEWRSRIKELKSLGRNSSRFEGTTENSDHQSQRWQRLSKNPWIELSALSIESHRLKELVTLLGNLINTAKTLFKSCGEVKIAEHFKLIQEMLRDSQDEEATYAEEKAVIDELFKRLDYSPDELTECFPGDLAEAIMLLIGGGLLDSESLEVQTGRDKGIAKPIYQVEASRILEEKNSGKVHLCMCDEDAMPGCAKSYPWPLSSGFIDRLDTSGRPECKALLSDLKFVVENAPLCNRYLFHSLLENSEVELSWISRNKEKFVESSPYVRLVEMKTGQSPIRSTLQGLDRDDVSSAKLFGRTTSPYALDLKKNIPSEAVMDFAQCRLKYLYGYMLQELPSYSSEFHCNFVLSRIIEFAMNYADQSDKKRAGEEILEMFSYLRDIEKRQIIDYVARPGHKKESIREARLKVHFLYKARLDDVREKYGELLVNGSTLRLDLIQPSWNKDNCTYCQHRNYCIYADADEIS